MASRNERRKRAKAANAERSERIANAAKAYERALIVKRNLSNPPERNFYPPVSCIGNMKAQSHRAYICRAGGGMERKRALALKAQGKW
jgi:hypothetical protein